MRKEGAEVEIGELGCGEGADGGMRRGAGEEDGERGEECGGVGETVNGDSGRVVGWERGHGEEDGEEGRGGAEQEEAQAFELLAGRATKNRVCIHFNLRSPLPLPFILLPSRPLPLALPSLTPAN